jgi:hypothetical protein
MIDLVFATSFMQQGLEVVKSSVVELSRRDFFNFFVCIIIPNFFFIEILHLKKE